MSYKFKIQAYCSIEELAGVAAQSDYMSCDWGIDYWNPGVFFSTDSWHHYHDVYTKLSKDLNEDDHKENLLILLRQTKTPQHERGGSYHG